jgi:uncharacterized membrane protein YgdD (TMEM256/DUF423 family)
MFQFLSFTFFSFNKGQALNLINPTAKNLWQSVAGFNGLMAVIMGAVAAHAIGDAEASALAAKASLYQLIHAAILLFIAQREERFLGLARWAFLTGMILFCGTLYLKALDIAPQMIMAAPAGGIAFMAGWLLIVIAGLRKP